jgi:chromosome segregation ATPase
MDYLKLGLRTVLFTLTVVLLLAFASCSDRYTQEELDAAVEWEQDRFDNLNSYTVMTVAQLEADKDSLNLEINDLTSRLALAAMENANLRAEIVELNDLNEELALVIEELKSKNDQLVNDLTLSEAKVELLTSEIKGLELTIMYLNTEIDTLTADLEAAYTIITDLNDTLDAYGNYVTRLLGSLNGMSSENSSLQSQIDDLKDTVSDKQDKIVKLRKRIKNIKARNKKDLEKLLKYANSLSATPWHAYFDLVDELKRLLD